MTARVPLLLVVVALLVAGCGGGPPTGSSGTGPVATPAVPPTDGAATSPVPTPRATLDDVAPTDPLGGPPSAALFAEGGDPVIGQLGTYLWLDGGSSSPWLPGAPIAVGAGEPLAVRLDPDTPIAAWQAWLSPGDADGPGGATPLATGIAHPSFQAPPPGTWILEVRVTFVDGMGEASYAWRLEIP